MNSTVSGRQVQQNTSRVRLWTRTLVLCAAGGEVHAEVRTAGAVPRQAASAAALHRPPGPAQQVCSSACDAIPRAIVFRLLHTVTLIHEA